MGSASSEPCLYERLSESIDKLRELGLRWGMSEDDIERCIAQALRVGERRERRSLASPIRTLAWFCLALLTSYWFLSTYQPTQYLTGRHADSWIHPIMRHVRLLALPIAKHYNLAEQSDPEYNLFYTEPSPNFSHCSYILRAISKDNFSNIFDDFSNQVQPIIIQQGGHESIELYSSLRKLHNKHGELIDLYADEISGSAGYPDRFSELFQQYPSGQTFAKSATTFQWLTWRSSAVRLLDEVFPQPHFPPANSRDSPFRSLIIQSPLAPPHVLTCGSYCPQAELWKMQSSNVWLVVGSGTLSLQFTAVPDCSSACPSFSVNVYSSDVGRSVRHIASGGAHQ
uniref:bombesin receptor-activated protein C6orf89 homolog isoform X2 n=1 Tax=Myxine glutinosa TaxID=7769 RepID=UPI00358EBD0C